MLSCSRGKPSGSIGEQTGKSGLIYYYIHSREPIACRFVPACVFDIFLKRQRAAVAGSAFGFEHRQGVAVLEMTEKRMRDVKKKDDETERQKKPEKRPDWASGLRQLYDSVVEEPLPDSFNDLLSKFDTEE